MKTQNLEIQVSSSVFDVILLSLGGIIGDIFSKVEPVWRS